MYLSLVSESCEASYQQVILGVTLQKKLSIYNTSKLLQNLEDLL